MKPCPLRQTNWKTTRDMGYKGAPPELGARYLDAGVAEVSDLIVDPAAMEQGNT